MQMSIKQKGFYALLEFMRVQRPGGGGGGTYFTKLLIRKTWA